MTLRIGAADVTPGIIERGPSGEAKSASGDASAYLERLVKLVPLEVVGAYPLVVQGADTAGPCAKPIASWVLLACVILIRAHATQVPGKGPQWAAVSIAAVSFVIWVYVMNGDFGIFNILKAYGIDDATIHNQVAYYRNVALVVWTTVVPFVYKGDDSIVS